MRLTDMLRAKAKGPESDPAEPEAGAWNEEVQSLSIDSIVVSPYQPRQQFDDAAIRELAQSIAEHGLLHPIVVRPLAERFELVVGERRLRACQTLRWERIPAIVRELSDKSAAEMALIENLQRKDLDFFEEADGYRRLLDEFGMTQEELATRLGKSQSAIANRLRLLKLPAKVRSAISREILSERHARALLKLETEEMQLQVVKAIVEKEMNVKQTEELVERMLGDKRAERKKARKKAVIKDLRLFSNSLRKLTESLEESGLDVNVEENDQEDFFVYTVRIKKPERSER